MRLQFDIELPIRPWVRRGTQVGIVVLALGASAIALGVPNEFVANTPVTAKGINDNFKNLETRLAKLETVATGSYCGATAQVSPALSATNGYSAASTSCKAVSSCSATSAHICRGDEMIRYATAAGANTPEGWIATGGSAVYSVNSASSDCVGFTNAAATNYGTTWAASYPQGRSCNATVFPLLCCN